LTVLNSTLAYNESTGEGGGIVMYRSSRPNTSGYFANFTLRNTIISNSPGVRSCFYLNSVTAQGEGNLIMNSSIEGSTFDDPHACPEVVSEDNPQLGALTLNAPGLTKTMAIGEGSPAIDGAGSNALPTDQRGVGRPKGTGSDIGAYEYGNTKPVAACMSVRVSAGLSCNAEADINNGSYDPDAGDTISLSQSPASPYAVGSRSVTLTVTDDEGATDSCSGTVTVVDDTPPTISTSLQVPTLNPTKNHDLVPVGLGASETDGCSTAPTTFQVQVFGDEDDQTPTDNLNTVFSPDASNIGVGTLKLRAERKDSGDGRVYLIVVKGRDSANNTGFTCTSVVVPCSTAAASVSSVNAQAASARSYCQAHGGTAPSGYFVIGDGPSVGPKKKQ
jgi:hypothetical protein